MDMDPQRPRSLTWVNLILVFKVIVDALRFMKDLARK